MDYKVKPGLRFRENARTTGLSRCGRTYNRFRCSCLVRLGLQYSFASFRSISRSTSSQSFNVICPAAARAAQAALISWRIRWIGVGPAERCKAAGLPSWDGFFFLVFISSSCIGRPVEAHARTGMVDLARRRTALSEQSIGCSDCASFRDSLTTEPRAGSCFDSLPCDQHFEFNSLAAAHRKNGLTALRQGLPMVNQVHGFSFPFASPTRTAPREASPGRRASPGTGKSRTKASWTAGICRFPRCPPSG